MKKNAKILIASAVGIAVLGAGTAALVLTKPAAEESSDDTSSQKSELIAYETDDISTLTVKNENGEFTINRLGKEKWGIDSIPEDYANSSAYNSAMTKAGGITAKMTAEMNASDLSKYGFDDPTATFSMTFKDNKFEPVSCSVGIKNEGENAWYFKVGDSSDVYLIGNSDLSFAFSKYLDYVNLSTLVESYTTESEHVNRVRVQRKDLEKDIVLDLLENVINDDREFVSTYVSYKMSSHNNILADDELDRDVVFGLFGISATRAAAVNPDDKTRSEYGLDTPLCTVSVIQGEKMKRLTIGSEIIESETNSETGETTSTLVGYYGMISDIDVVYVFSPDTLPWLTIKPEDMLYRLFLSPYIYYLDNVTVLDTDRKEYKFVIEGDADKSRILYNNEEIDHASFTKFYQYLLSCAAEEMFVREDGLSPDNKFIAGFTYNYRESNDGTQGLGFDTVELYSSVEDRTCIIVVNGDVRYKIRQMYAGRLLDNLNALLTGGSIVSEI